MNIQWRILKFVIRANWILLLVTCAVGGMIATCDFTTGVLAGGLIVTVNFHLMYRSLRKHLNPPPHLSSAKSVFVKHYLRFVSSIIVIYILISKNYVDPGGLLIGLSTVVVSIMMASLFELKKILTKEAV
jgi:hypothetical protein